MALLASCAAALAQAPSPACQRLEAQLAAIDRGGGDPARADQARRYEEAAIRQQSELDKLVTQSRRQGCERSGFFSAFGQSIFGGGDGNQCPALERRIDQMRANLDRMQAEAQQGQGTNLQRGEQRRSVLIALTDNNCGPQYRSTAGGGRGFFETIFSGNNNSLSPDQAGGGYRTICVRTCDGAFFPISFAANQSKFRDDERVCQRMCPAAEVALYAHRNPGEEVAQAVSMSGQPYSALPTAFKFRQQFDPACSCRKAGQTWADALKQIEDTVEQGDIVVNDERAKKLSQPRTDAQGRPVRQDTRTQKIEPKPDVTGSTIRQEEQKPPEAEGTKRPVRSVGPQFIPTAATPSRN